MQKYVFIILTSLVLCLPIEALAQKKAKKKNTKKDYVVTISTAHGDMVLILYDETPKHKENFLKLVNEGFYDGTTFHRVMNGFMIQGGDPNSKKDGDKSKIGSGGPGYTVDAEFVDKYTHVKGALAAARQGDRVNPKKASSGSQFYIVHNAKSCRHLNGSYTVYGQVIDGMEVIDLIAAQDVNRGNMPLEDIPVTMTSKLLKKKKITKLYAYSYDEG